MMTGLIAFMTHMAAPHGVISTSNGAPINGIVKICTALAACTSQFRDIKMTFYLPQSLRPLGHMYIHMLGGYIL